MRLFIAIDTPPWIKRSMEAAQRELPPEGLRLVSVENIHITLKFLGEVNQKKLQRIEQKLREIDEKDFEIVVRGVGVFPNENYIRVVWAGCKTRELAEFAEKISRALPEFPAEPFSGHLTLARVSRKIDLRPFLQRYRDFRFGDFKANKFCLMMSELSPSGPKYSVVAEFPLKSE